MELEHTFTVPVPVEQAWQVLLDLHRIAPCMPGASLTSYEGDEFAGTVAVRLGPVNMSFAGQGRFVERDPAGRRIVVEASGRERRGGGSARATVRSSLREAGDSTVVQVHTDLVVTGRVAQFGRGMIADVSGRLLDQFTGCLAERLAGEPAATEPATAPPATAPPATAPPATAPPATAPPAAAPEPAAVAAEAPRPAPPATKVEPIDLLAVTGVRAAAGRLLPYVLTFLAGGLVGGLIVWLAVG